MIYESLFFRVHALERMLEHDISEIEVRDVLEHDDAIESGVDQFGMPKTLYLGFVNNRPIHVAAVNDDQSMRTEIITAYEPDLNRWQPGFRTRKRR